ncbi:TetR family transcriptional regulator [soil metagenome]
MAAARTSKEKQTRNPEMTRERLLVAATELFSARGYDGIAVDDIVKAAKVNKRMVYHYFADKSGLYAEVLRRVFGRLAEIELKTFEDAKDPVETIQKILRAYFQFLGDNPEFVALLAWENLHKGRFIEANPNLLSKAPVLRRLEELLREGVARGLFRPGVKVKHLLIDLIGVCFVYHANRYTLSQSVGLNLHSPKVLREGLEHAIGLILQGLLLKPGK